MYFIKIAVDPYHYYIISGSEKIQLFDYLIVFINNVKFKTWSFWKFPTPCRLILQIYHRNLQIKQLFIVAHVNSVTLLLNQKYPLNDVE